MKLLLILLLMLSEIIARGAALTVQTKRLTDGIRAAESNEGKNLGTLGHHGMTQAAWSDVSKWRELHKLPAFDYSRRTDYNDSGVYCAEYLTILYKRFQEETHRSPKIEDLLAMYNRGFAAMERLDFDWRKLGFPFKVYVARVRRAL